MTVHMPLARVRSEENVIADEQNDRRTCYLCSEIPGLALVAGLDDEVPYRKISSAMEEHCARFFVTLIIDHDDLDCLHDRLLRKMIKTSRKCHSSTVRRNDNGERGCHAEAT